MTLLELSEPLFQYVCRLNRSVRKGVRPDVAQTRAELKAIFADMKSRSSGNPALANQYDRVRLPLVFFVDFMVRDSGAVGRSWTDLANEEHPPQLGGDEKFFDLVDEVLKETGEAANERLGVLYTCVGLGFTGWYQGQPEYLRKKMLELSSRMRGTMELDDAAKICPESYEKVNTSDLVQPPGSKLVGIAIAMVGLILIVFAANIAAYLDHRAAIDRSLKNVLEPGGDGSGSHANAGGAP